MESIDLGRGINLRLIECDKFETVSIGVLLRRPLKRDEVTYNALLAGVLNSGSSKYPTIRSINIELEKMYGAVFQGDIMKKGEEQLLEFYIEILNKKGLVTEAFQFLSELISKPLIENEGFKEEYLKVEKENLENIIKGKINDKREYAKERLIEIMCEHEPYGLSGDGYIEDLEGLNGEMLYRHYKYVLESSPIEVLVIGNVSRDEIIREINNAFDWERRDIEQIPKAKYKTELIGGSEKEEILDIAQGKLCIGIRANAEPIGEEYYKALIVNEILGGSANSKLFMNLREKESLCYYISSMLYRFKSIIMIQAGIENSKYKDAVEMIKKAIEDIKKYDFTKEELENAKINLINKYKVLEDYPSNIMDYYLGQAIIGDDEEITQVIEKIESIDDVRGALDNSVIDTVYFLRGENNG